MNFIRTHIISKAIVILLSMILLVPLFVKLDHIFAGHEHEVCTTPGDLHFHNLQLECKFYDFRLNTYYYKSPEVIEILVLQNIEEIVVSQYHFISHYQRLQFSLRGPPAYV